MLYVNGFLAIFCVTVCMKYYSLCIVHFEWEGGWSKDKNMDDGKCWILQTDEE